MDQYLTVNVVTPDGLVYDHHAAIVVARTTAGELGILPKHAPIIVPLTIDEVRVKRTDSDTHVDWIAVNGGIMEVRDNVVSIVADSAERERDIDVSRAERQPALPRMRSHERRRHLRQHELRRHLEKRPRLPRLLRSHRPPRLARPRPCRTRLALVPVDRVSLPRIGPLCKDLRALLP